MLVDLHRRQPARRLGIGKGRINFSRMGSLCTSVWRCPKGWTPRAPANQQRKGYTSLRLESLVRGRLCGPQTIMKLHILTPGLAAAVPNQVFLLEVVAAIRDDSVQASILFLPAALTPDGETCLSGLIELRVSLPAEVPRARRRASTAGAHSCPSPSSCGRRSATRRSSSQVKICVAPFWGPSGGQRPVPTGTGRCPIFRAAFLGAVFTFQKERNAARFAAAWF